jgi:hypothetical protein
VQGTHEELTALLADPEASERSVDATVQMLRLLGMPPREIQQAFLSGRELCAQNVLKAARARAHAAAQRACNAVDASADLGNDWPGIGEFLLTLGDNMFPRIAQVRGTTPLRPALPPGMAAVSCM